MSIADVAMARKESLCVYYISNQKLKFQTFAQKTSKYPRDRFFW